jgi:hypothetical protein
MISAKEHNNHHKTYDGSFCIGSGASNHLFEWIIQNVTSNKWFWSIFFISTLIFDVPVFNYFLTTFLGA